MNYAIREAFAGFKRAPILVFISATMVGLALYVVGLFGLVAHNLNVTLGEVEERVQVVAYLREDATSEEVAQAVDEVSARLEVRVVHYIPKAEALDRARATSPDLFGDSGVNPLPASLEIVFEREYRVSEAVAAVVEHAERYPFVEEVEFGAGWIDELFALRRAGVLTTAVLGSAFGLVAALIIGFAIRMAVFARREEIGIMRLVGAKNGFIRLPFILEGGLTGLLGGAVALLLTFLTFLTVQKLLFELSWIPGLWIFLGIVLGAFFGFMASALAVHRYLREV